MLPFKQTSTPCSDTTNAPSPVHDSLRATDVWKFTSFSQATLQGSIYSCISTRYKTLSFMASRMPLFPGFTLSVGYFLFFSHNSFFCMCLHKFWCFQGFPLLGTLLYYTQNPKGFPAQVFYQLYTEPSKNLPPA